MEIILIRHAQSKGNKENVVQGQTDEGLSDLGKIQAEALANFFQKGDFTVIYSSDLGRAEQTAIPTAKKFGLKIFKDPDLREAHFGIWEGLTYDEVKEKYSKEYTAWHQNYHVRPHWFESFELHQNRTKKAINNVISCHRNNERIAIFTHGGSIKTQVAFFNNLSGEELVEFRTKNCSLTTIKFNSSLKYEDGQLIYYNKEVISAGEGQI